MKDSDTNKSGLFRITVFNAEYTCSLKDRVYSQRQVTNNLVGRIVKPKLIDHKRKYTPSNIKKKKDMKLDLGVDISYMLAWRAKERVLISLKGTPGGSYNKLPLYLYILGVLHIQNPIYACRQQIKILFCTYLFHWILSSKDLTIVDL